MAWYFHAELPGVGAAGVGKIVVELVVSLHVLRWLKNIAPEQTKASDVELRAQGIGWDHIEVVIAPCKPELVDGLGIEDVCIRHYSRVAKYIDGTSPIESDQRPKLGVVGQVVGPVIPKKELMIRREIMIDLDAHLGQRLPERKNAAIGLEQGDRGWIVGSQQSRPQGRRQPFQRQQRRGVRQPVQIVQQQRLRRRQPAEDARVAR